MPTERQSEESNQLTLLGDGMAVLAEEERKGNWTGERLKSCRPKVYQAVIDGLANGIHRRQLGRMYSVSPNSVAAIAIRESSVIEALKTYLGRKATVLYAQLMEEIEADINDESKMAKTSFKDKLVAANILNEQRLLSEGLPTQIQRVERIAPEDINNRFLSALPADFIDADGPQMGFGGDLPETKGAAIDADVSAIEGDSSGLELTEGELKSPASKAQCANTKGVDQK